MTAKRHASIATTTYPNTSWSDKEAEVCHTVIVSLPNGTSEKVRLMARHPFDASERVENMTEAQYRKLQRA